MCVVRCSRVVECGSVSVCRDVHDRLFFHDWNSRNKAAGPFCVADVPLRMLRLPRFNVAVDFEEVEAFVVVSRLYREPQRMSQTWAELSVLLKRADGRFVRYPIIADCSEGLVTGMARQLCRHIDVPCRAFELLRPDRNEAQEYVVLS